MQDLVESTWRWRDAGTPMRRRRRIVRGEIMGFLDFSPVSPRPRKTLKGVALRADLPVIQLSDAFNEVFEGAAEAIQLPDNEGVTNSDIGERFCEAFPLSFCAGGGIGEDLRTPCLKECITLEVKCLVSGGDAGVAD